MGLFDFYVMSFGGIGVFYVNVDFPACCDESAAKYSTLIIPKDMMKDHSLGSYIVIIHIVYLTSICYTSII